MSNPDYVYNPDDWEWTSPWADRNHLAEQCEVEFAGVVQFKTLVQGPDKFCVRIDGEYVWFDHKGEAEAAWKAEAAKPE